MKYIDKFLKFLKTDRNTFCTYILTLLTIYICVDRIVEIILIAATGMGASYWGPLAYTAALACPVFAFYLSFSSKFVTETSKKLTFTYIYLIAVYIIVCSMAVQWINQVEWIILLSVPNYSYIVLNFYDLIKPAMASFAWYIPIVTFWPLFKFIYMKINDTKLLKDSIKDYGGINLSEKKDGLGPYFCEMLLCKDKVSGKMIKIPEFRRFESTLVIGVSGSGKTTMIFEPFIARDIEKKYMLKEASKEMAYTALRTGIAKLNSPYSDQYINDNFNLNMIAPNDDKSKLFKSYFKKLIYAKDGDKIIYRTLGLTYMAPDYASIGKMINVADNFGIKYNLVDPNDGNSIGLNPFSIGNPIKTSIAISSVLRRLYTTQANTINAVSTESAFQQNIAAQAFESLTLLLAEMYPRLHDGAIPTLEDLLSLISNFDEIEKLSEQMAAIPELAEKYHIQIDYFKATFYKTAAGRENTARNLQSSTAQLDNLLRYPGVKNILCNRTNNLNFDNVLANGEVVFCCTRRGDLGAGIHQAVGLFFLLLMQHSVLSRPGTEDQRIPHFLYIDEFPPFICKATADIFTIYRKYRVGTTISAQNLSQFGTEMNVLNNYKQTILANCTTEIVFGNNTPEDNEWWNKEFGQHREWLMNYNYHTDKGEYDANYTGIKWGWKDNVHQNKLQTLAFKNIAYKTRNAGGKIIVGTAGVDFLDNKYKEPHKIKTYNFTRFQTGIQQKMSTDDDKKKFDIKHIDCNPRKDHPNDMDPIQMNEDGRAFSFENTEDGILNLQHKPEYKSDPKINNTNNNNNNNQ